MWYQTQMPLIFVMYFLDIGQCFHLVTKKTVLAIENPAPLGSTKIIYLTFSKYSRPLQKEWGNRQRQTGRISELPTDRHFLDLSETCLYMVHLRLEHFFPKFLSIKSIYFFVNNVKKSTKITFTCFWTPTDYL